MLDLEHVLRTALDGVRDGMAVRRADHEDPQDQHVERALRRLALQRRFTARHDQLAFDSVVYASESLQKWRYEGSIHHVPEDYLPKRLGRWRWQARLRRPPSGGDWNIDDVVEGVAFERLSPGGANQPAELRRRHPFRGRRPGHVINLFFLHGAVEVVDTKPQRGLGQLHAGRNPEPFDVRNVVEH